MLWPVSDSSMVFPLLTPCRVEQPVGTGFSIGTPTATSEEEIAQDFIKFFKNFESLFGIANYKIYVTGESYAGRYVSYISAAMLEQNDTKHYDLSGKLPTPLPWNQQWIYRVFLTVDCIKAPLCTILTLVTLTIPSRRSSSCHLQCTTKTY